LRNEEEEEEEKDTKCEKMRDGERKHTEKKDILAIDTANFREKLVSFDKCMFVVGFVTLSW
jgi:hypothetical protein